MSDALYTREILRLATSVPHLGLLNDPHGFAELRSPACGSRMGVSVNLSNNRVAELGQSVSACAFGQASAALMGAHAVGASRAEVAAALGELSDWLAGSRDTPGDWPGLDMLAPARAKAGRHGAILLPFRTLLAAIDAA